MDLSYPRTVLVILLAGMFCIPATVASEPQASVAMDSGRGEFLQAETAELEFDNVTFSNSSLSFSIPTNSTIFSASVDLEGRPVIGPPREDLLDFSGDNANFVAFSGTTTKNTPGTAKPTSFSGNQLQAGDLGRISCQDGSCAEQWAYGWNGEYGYHHFKFKVPLDIISNFSVAWTGYAGYYYYGYGTACAYIWNNVTLSWETIGTVSGSPKTASNSFVNGSNYVDWNKCVHILALCKTGSTYYGYSYNNIDTDYVKVVARGNVLTYPKNPSMDIGANGKVEWSLQEEKFDYMVNVGDVTLTNELQTLVKNSAGRYKAVTIKFRSDSIGRLNVTNFTVAYNAPPWCKTIPDTFHLNEDNVAPKLINLSRYFEDDQPNLRYEITYEENNKLLDAELDGDGYSLSFKLPTRNWWGNMSFRVSAIDPEEKPLSRESNSFIVTVDPVNDPPVMNTITRQVAIQDKTFKLAIGVKDADCELDETEQVTFADNCSLFDINPSTGVINFTPKQNQVGVYNVQITATDREGARDSENFTLEVQDANDPPTLAFIPDQTAVQDQQFSCKITARDQDIPYGDALEFSDDSMFFQIEPATGYIYVTPTIRDLGVHRVAITVTDHGGLSDRKTFNITVVNQIGNFDRPPSVSPVANQTLLDGTRLVVEVKASDPELDDGDVLSFSDDCPLFDIDPATGIVDFTPAREDAGNYRVTITVKDRDGLAATTGFWLTVAKTNHPPAVSSITPEDGIEVFLGGRMSFSANATDPDGDELNYTWTDGATVLGYGPMVELEFGELATYLITLTVSDGRLSVENETSVIVLSHQTGGGTVKQQKSALPGFELLATAAALCAALAAATRRKNR
jgi:hypothetical protein